ncbi:MULTISPECIES: ImmA/IrrE family metallo-endopeptidase [Methylobacterium]|uniref:ImmA/IrrE family metallo-endopeptidase n=1 Tax=Methylobacterium TaxID=407 RepID=UPI0013EE17DF|nr:helix-turn-helix domain-containing protein [Methylobacterium sp. DB0501]NGM38282.1 ImmA/IrrE family metallo-endopeptidase [Methylobacterium sp. DB0501]
MIATQLQYQVTQDRIKQFYNSLSALQGSASSWLRDLQVRDIRDKIAELESALEQYDSLTTGDIKYIVVERLADLPNALIKARLLAGLSQRELARQTRQSLLKIQQWERDGYSRVSVDVIRSIAATLPIELRGWARTDVDPPSRPALKTLLARAGLPKEVYDDVIVPAGFEGIARDDEIDRRLERLFGLGVAQFANGAGFDAVPLRFKLPANAEQSRTRAYASYVEGVCSIIATTQPSVTGELPKHWSEMRRLLFPDGVISLATAVRQCWSVGIGVIGLRDKVAFHGACRRVDGRATIILKPSSRHSSRWLFSLIHEIFHIISEDGDFTLIEGDETSRDRREAPNERRANRFAAMVLTNGALADAFTMVSRRSGGRVTNLTAAVRAAADFYRIPVGILANLVAEDVQSSGRANWWGSAEKLQPIEENSWKIVRDVFIESFDRRFLNSTEAAVLYQLLETRDE